MVTKKVGFVAHIREKKNANRILFGKPIGRRPRGRPRHRSNDNIKIVLKERE
jgi:hypothetical protein